MSQMLGRDFVQSRLGSEGSGISYAEFSYSLIQGYDFVHLYRKYGVTLQLCGADQWGNSLTGVDLIRRMDGAETHVYSTPLIINKATGVKFGKTEGGAIWLDAKKTSVYKFYQFWLNSDDAGVIDYIKIYTLLDKKTVDNLEVQVKTNPGARVAQRSLAHEVTALVHGAERTLSVEKVTDVLFGKIDFADLSSQEIDMLASEIPTVKLGKTIVEILIEANLASGKGDAKRLLTSSAITINGDKISDDQSINKVCLVKKGKNSFILVR